MCKNRPKIWIDENTYVYRSDFNTRKWYDKRYKRKSTDEDLLNDCFKYSHKYLEYEKGDILKVTFKANHTPYFFEPQDHVVELLRVDYNGNEEPYILLVRPVRRWYQYGLKITDIKSLEKVNK